MPATILDRRLYSTWDFKQCTDKRWRDHRKLALGLGPLHFMIFTATPAQKPTHERSICLTLLICQSYGLEICLGMFASMALCAVDRPRCGSQCCRLPGSLCPPVRRWKDVRVLGLPASEEGWGVALRTNTNSWDTKKIGRVIDRERERERDR